METKNNADAERVDFYKLAARIERLEIALRPFAGIIENMALFDDDGDGRPIAVIIPLGCIRRAKRELNQV